MTRPIDPSWIDVMHAWMEQYQNELHTAFPGKVEAYNASRQTVDVRPLVRHPVAEPDGTQSYEELPVVPAVPVVFPRTAQWFFTLPIARGDTVLVICCESAIGHWWAGSGALQHPGDLRRHHLAHAVAIPGLFSKGQALPSANASSTDMMLGKAGGATIKVTASGDVVFSGGSIPVAKEGSGTTGHQHNGTGMTAGPYPVSGMTMLATDTIATGAGSQTIKVP